jgi:hypothetical protein
MPCASLLKAVAASQCTRSFLLHHPFALEEYDMSRFALDQLFMHGHFVTPAALRALNLDANQQQTPAAPAVVSTRVETVALDVGRKFDRMAERRRRLAHR